MESGGTTTIDESAKATAALRHGVELPGHLYGLHELRQRGHRIDLIGLEKIENINCYALQLTLDDGYVTTLYVDPKSWLITYRRDVRALHVDIDPTPTTIEQRMSDFRQVAGVWFPFANTETDLKLGKCWKQRRFARSRSIQRSTKRSLRSFSLASAIGSDRV